jgi:hypothetical protein
MEDSPMLTQRGNESWKEMLDRDEFLKRYLFLRGRSRFVLALQLLGLLAILVRNEESHESNIIEKWKASSRAFISPVARL